MNPEGREKRSIFRFLNFWAHDEDYHDNLIQYIHNLQTSLSAWHREKFGKLETEIRKLEMDLQISFSSYSHTRYIQKRVLLDHLPLVQESHWKQQAQNDKILLGDRNTKYFHRKFNSRRRKNKILGIKNPRAMGVQENDSIGRVLTDHRSNLMTSSAIGNDPLIPNLFPTVITDEQNFRLICPPSDIEILNSQVPKFWENARS